MSDDMDEATRECQVCGTAMPVDQRRCPECGVERQDYRTALWRPPRTARFRAAVVTILLFLLLTTIAEIVFILLR